MERLSERLNRVASFVPQGARLLDVGSDHAYLPLYLLAQGRIEYAVAGEVVEGPYRTALANVTKGGPRTDLLVRLADGLEAMEVSDRIDTISIAGMGGALIADILTRGMGQLSQVKRLILQPNNREDDLRRWLNQHNFCIVAEDIVEEHGKFYEIIVSESGQQNLSEKDLRFGPYLLLQGTDVFLKRWRLEADKLKLAQKKIPQTKLEERSAISKKIQAIEEVLDASK